MFDQGFRRRRAQPNSHAKPHPLTEGRGIGRRPEQALHRAVVDHLAWRGAPGVFAFHVPNGGWRSRIEAAQRTTHERMRTAGATVATAFGLDEALAQLAAWELLRPNVCPQKRSPQHE